MAMTKEEMEAFKNNLAANEKAKNFARPFDMAKAMAHRLGEVELVQTEIPDETFYLGSFNGFFAPAHERAAEIVREALIEIGSVEKYTHVFVPEGRKDPEDQMNVGVYTSLPKIQRQQLLQAIQAIQAAQSPQVGA